MDEYTRCTINTNGSFFLSQIDKEKEEENSNDHKISYPSIHKLDISYFGSEMDKENPREENDNHYANIDLENKSRKDTNDNGPIKPHFVVVEKGQVKD